jgi:hypothetical protein
MLRKAAAKTKRKSLPMKLAKAISRHRPKFICEELKGGDQRHRGALQSESVGPRRQHSHGHSHLEQSREEEGKLTYLWLLILVFLFMLYGLYVWELAPR